MHHGPIDPELDVVASAFLAAGARFVVIGGFAVIANRYVRATEDIDLLIPDDGDNDARCDEALRALAARWPIDGRAYVPGDLTGREHSRLGTVGGLVDLLREGVEPLDFRSVSDNALRADLGSGEFRIAGLRSLVAFKRLAGRPRDRADLAELEAVHGPLPDTPFPERP